MAFIGYVNPEQGCCGHDHDLDSVLVSLLEESTFQCELATTDYELSMRKQSSKYSTQSMECMKRYYRMKHGMHSWREFVT